MEGQMKLFLVALGSKIGTMNDSSWKTDFYLNLGQNFLITWYSSEMDCLVSRFLLTWTSKHMVDDSDKIM